jgi:XTP/dITP diphosphohydrolase
MTPTPTPLIIASGNAGKVREFAALLAELPLAVRPQSEGLEVEETGATFAENARIKAAAVAHATGCWALADDSGLAVDALAGAPGVRSARYAPTDAERIARLLTELEAEGATAPERRGAAFIAALALADPGGTVRLAVEGRCAGRILPAPRGTGGFGYDPVFLVPELNLTFAEMDKATKGRVGHRGRAFALLEPGLRELLGAG